MRALRGLAKRSMKRFRLQEGTRTLFSNADDALGSSASIHRSLRLKTAVQESWPPVMKSTVASIVHAGNACLMPKGISWRRCQPMMAHLLYPTWSGDWASGSKRSCLSCGPRSSRLGMCTPQFGGAWPSPFLEWPITYAEHSGKLGNPESSPLSSRGSSAIPGLPSSKDPSCHQSLAFGSG